MLFRSQEGSLSSTPSPAFIVSRFFDDGHSDRCEVISHFGFDLHFPDDSDIEHPFFVPVGHLYVFGKKCI